MPEASIITRLQEASKYRADTLAHDALAEIERLRDGLRRLAGDRSDGPSRRIAQEILDGAPDETTGGT
jgi:hypothetical protein